MICGRGRGQTKCNDHEENMMEINIDGNIEKEEEDYDVATTQSYHNKMSGRMQSNISDQELVISKGLFDRDDFAL